MNCTLFTARPAAGRNAAVLTAIAVKFSSNATLEVRVNPALLVENARKLLVLMNRQPLQLLYPPASTAAGQGAAAVPSLTITVQSGVRVERADQSRVLMHYVLASLAVDCSFLVLDATTNTS